MPHPKRRGGHTDRQVDTPDIDAGWRVRHPPGPPEPQHHTIRKRTGAPSINPETPEQRGYADVAGQYAAQGFAPIPVKGKRPVPAGATGRNGVVDDAKIYDWMNDAEWGRQNTALRLQGCIGIDVDEYGEKHGAAQLAELESRLGTLPATITSTSRGQESASRQHFYLIPQGVELPGSIADDIEVVQFHHRYSVVWPSIHPDTGEQYRWYGYDGEPLDEIPSIGDFEMLPDAWIDYFTALKPTIAEGTQSAATNKPAHPTEDEQRKLTWIRNSLESLPRGVWTEGSGWHDTVVHAACWLWRMVRHNDYAITEEAALSLMMAHTPTYPDWGQDKIMEQWLSCRETTKGQLEPAPAIAVPPLMAQVQVVNDLPEFASDGTPFLRLLGDEPIDHDLARRTIAREVLLAGLSERHALTAVYQSAAGRPLQAEFDGLQRIWREVESVKLDIVSQLSATPSTVPGASEPPAPVTVTERASRYPLLAERERLYLAEHGSWWGTRYLEWAQSRVKAFNAPYHRMNRWNVLSLVFSPYGRFPVGEGFLLLNLFMMVLGKTTTGKTAAMKLLKIVIRAIFGQGGSPNIGGDASPNALVEKLIERDGQASWFNADEAHGLFEEMQGTTWRAGLIQKWTDLYEGEVPMILRKQAADLSGVEAVTYFVMHLMGTEEGMTEVLDAEMWKSGFLARFVWAIGEDLEETDESVKLNIRRGEKANDIDQMPAQWAAEFDKVTHDLSRMGRLPLTMDMTPAAEERFNQFALQLRDMVKGHPYEDRLKPTRIRFALNITKCACLVALSEGTPLVDERHVLIALEQAEEWWANIMHMVRATDETLEARRVNELENMIAKHGGHMTLEQINRLSRHNRRTVDALIGQLQAEGRIDTYDAPDTSFRKQTVVQLRTEAIAA